MGPARSPLSTEPARKRQAWSTSPAGDAAINVGINSAVAFQKIGAGVLTLSAPSTITGNIPLTARNTLTADLLVGGFAGSLDGGMLRLASASVLPTSTRMAIGNGYIDIGSNNVTLGSLTFTNQVPPGIPWNTTLNANNGVIGSGTLRVTGEINVIGQSANAAGNSIASNFDLGGGTQVIRVGALSLFGLNTALMFNGSISNGSLLKTVGFTTNGTIASVDGISLNGNNTYTGSTVLNGGANVATGTNASTSIKTTGAAGGAAQSNLSLLGANGSFLSATLIQVLGGSTFLLDNNTTLGSNGFQQPLIPAAQNNNRIRDDVQVQLRDANFIYRGFSGAAATETFGSLNVLDGYNTVTLTPNGGGSIVLTATGDLTFGSRATLGVASTTLGGASQLFFNGSIPTADATGILPRVVGSSDFLTYNGTTGLTPFTGYATDFSTPGTNVSLAAATSTNSVAINALKLGGTFTTTVNAGETLGITSGMILSASGSPTIAGGTVAFGANPGVVFGNLTISSAITGTQGLIMATGTSTLSGNMAGLSGPLTVQGATTSLATNTFSGPIQIRAGRLNLNTSQTGSGLGAITLGAPENETNLYGTLPVLSLSGAGANAVFDRPIIVDNGTTSLVGVANPFSYLAAINPLSNATGSQTLNGDLTLNTSVNFQGGGGGGTGATNFTGAITGPGTFVIPNGRVNFTATSSISNAGGFLLGNPGFTAIATFAGATSGSVPITINGGNSNSINYQPGSLPTGTITVQNALGTTAPTIRPLGNSTINNTINLNGDAIANVGSGIIANWDGTLNGASQLTKAGTGTLVLGNAANTHTGAVAINAGTLAVNGTLPSATVTVANTGTLGGTGNLTGSVTVNSGGTLSPGNSIGTFATGSLSLSGTFLAEIDLNNGGAASADLLNLSGSFNITGGMLMLSLSNLPAAGAMGTFLLVANDGTDAINGTFGSITGLPGGVSATVDYAFVGTDSLGRIGNGNDLAVNIVPEPQSWALLAFGALSFLAFRRVVGAPEQDRSPHRRAPAPPRLTTDYGVGGGVAGIVAALFTITRAAK